MNKLVESLKDKRIIRGEGAFYDTVNRLRDMREFEITTIMYDAVERVVKNVEFSIDKGTLIYDAIEPVSGWAVNTSVDIRDIHEFYLSRSSIDLNTIFIEARNLVITFKKK
ncbi:MAG: hypothetical protein ACRCX8_05540, partial [Sarcina sp.]